MALPYAFVTLLTSDFYLPGALALAAALRDIHPSPSVEPEVDFQTVCIVTPETLDISTIKLLRRTFDVVVGVELITQEDDKGLQLLGRPDLYTVLTKLHVFRLTQYAKIIFLDADVLPIRPLSHLFTLPHEFSAVPDVGWPDIFNSGVMVLSPAEDKFTELNSLLKSRGSWDGGDQGILNEWRGGDWNRLSFVYNTTPTAAYTYAPAYERFGSQIKAIHFIGPNKPWNSIPHRAPFSGDQSFSATSSAVYDFNSLLDRWFAVYDKHYRSKSIIPESEFAVRKYVAAWDAQTGTGAALVSIADQQGGGPSAVLGLEDLRRLAIEGMSAAGHSGGNQSGEGEYRSLPLEGRVDLMAPQGAAPSHASQPTHHEPSVEHPTPDTTPVARHHNLPIPGPDEFPPNSHPQPVPLPSHTPAHEAGYPSTVQESTPSQPTIHQTAAAHPPVTQSHHESTGLQQQHYHHQEPYRPSSPPKMAWNPAIEPPPNTAPTLNAFPSDTYFPNVWDQPPSRVHDQSIQYQSRSPSSPTPAPSAFFEPPPVPDIPQQLRHQGHYRNVTGDENHDSSPSPDPTKVKAVFPWEEQKRHRPGRVFPTYDPPSPSQFLSPEPQSSPLVQSPPAPASQPLSPLQGLPFSLTYANAWDTVPSIQKYANRLVRPPQPPPLAPPFDSKDWKKRGGGRSWDERTEASSRDGDDEDEGEDEEESRHPGRWTDDSDNESSTNQSRSRGSSVSSSYAIKGKKKEYRVRGVQTISPVMRSQGVQVAIATQPTRNQRPSAIPLPATVNQVSGGADVSMTTAFPSPSGGSPREFVFPDAPATVRPAAVSTPPPRARRDTDSSSITRQSSNDGSSLASPPSSTGPLSPPEGQSLPELPPVRKPAGRVFDPARGIELFKRGSEEVLARFLKMSSWEEDPTQAQATH